MPQSGYVMRNEAKAERLDVEGSHSEPSGRRVKKAAKRGPVVAPAPSGLLRPSFRCWHGQQQGDHAGFPLDAETTTACEGLPACREGEPSITAALALATRSRGDWERI